MNAVATDAAEPALDAARERLLLDVVEEALDWPEAEFEARLTTRLADDPSLLPRVRALLGIATRSQRVLPTRLPLAAALGAEAPPPERLGPYRVGELLGRGGMGRVFRAERADGVFEQEVAIKLMRRSFASEALAQQFARERQILANLQHPHIARLLDGGVTDDGQSYIVMELLQGEPLTDFAKRRDLDLRATVRLVLPVCAAVAHAHSRLVVHADIKPSNVIVTANGQVRLLDFGVARVLEAAKAGDAGETGTTPIGLTQEYASPARRRNEPATTVDDVYSLGVLIEELLRRFPDAPPDLRAVAVRARSDDLATRYATVDALREDLQRWLDGLTVQAFGNDWRYALRKTLARHRAATAIGAAALLLLTVAAVALSVLYLRAERARAEAERRFADVRSLSNYVLFDVYDRLGRVPRALPLRRDLADEAQQYLDRLASDPGAPPGLRLEVAEGLRRLAQVQAAPGDASLGEHDTARANLARARRMVEALGNVPALRDERDLAMIRLDLLQATIAHSIELDFEAANDALGQARASLDDLLARAPASPEARSLERDWAVERAAVLQWQGEYDRSRQVAADALARLPATPARADDGRLAIQRARLLDILAESLFYAGKAREAEAPYREQWTVLDAAARAHPDDLSLERRAARAAWALGSTLLELERAAEAEPLLAQSEARFERLRLLEPDDRELARSLDISASAHAQALYLLKRYTEAEPVLRRSIEYRAGLLEADASNASLRRDLAIARATLGDALGARGARREACGIYAQAALDFERIRASGRLPNLDRDYGLRRLRAQQARLCPN